MSLTDKKKFVCATQKKDNPWLDAVFPYMFCIHVLYMKVKQGKGVIDVNFLR